MTDQFFPESQLPIRKTVDLLPGVFKTETNSKFMAAAVDPLVQPGLLQKTVGYVGRRYGKTYSGLDTYLDSDNTLRSRYQLEPGVVFTDGDKVENFYDYIDFKNQLKFFGNTIERDDLITAQEHYSWNPPISWDKFINYREYFWEPDGPLAVPVSGHSAKVISEYTVKASKNSFVFTEVMNTANVVNNPTLTLYRGQTYKFAINTPNDSFIIRTQYDTGSIVYNPTIAYDNGQLAVYENQLIRSKIRIVASATRTTPNFSTDWEFVRFIYQTAFDEYVSGIAYSVGDTVVYSNELWEAVSNIPSDEISLPVTGSADWRFIGYVVKAPTLEYNTGVVNNGASNATVIFQVPYDSPDILFYQSPLDPNKLGKFVIENISENTEIDIANEIIGLKNYTSSNGVKFTNGLVVEFRGSVTPATYTTDTWLVSGVGSSISLMRFSDLVTPRISKEVPEVLFDNEGFDTQPFDNASAYPKDQDYITIANSSIDSNSWSRYNRWFHRSVLEYSCAIRGQEYNAPESNRAKRPIIEFSSNLKLFNHGSIAKRPVDFVDTKTTDVFSTIEGSAGYQIDNESLFHGARILITADTDNLVNNKIYEVQLITFNHNTQTVTDTTTTIVPQIHLVETDDSVSFVDECVLVKRGKIFGGEMFHYNGLTWGLSQQKTAVNQAPLFDVYDDNGISFSNTEYYPGTTFNGSKILSYKVGNGRVDTQLGFSLSYLNIGNVGDIQFNWDFGIDSFKYVVDFVTNSRKIESGYYKLTNIGDEYSNGWVKTNNSYIQPIIDSQVITEVTTIVTFTTIDFAKVPVSDLIIRLYVNGKPYTKNYYREGNTFTFPSNLAINDVVAIKVIANVDPNTGYYEIPAGLEKNPLNQDMTTFTLGQADDHITSAAEFFSGFSGVTPGVSNLRDLTDYQPYATRFLKHSGIAPLAVSMLCDKTHNVIKSLQYAKKMYTLYKNNFIEKAAHCSGMNTIDAVDDIISALSSTKSSESPFANSDMLGSGAYTPIRYTVEDTGIKTFALSKKFNLTELSTNAVYVYVYRVGTTGKVTQTQLINSKEYVFNDVFGYVTLTVELLEGDVVEIREYLSTAVNYIPATPSSIGLYKKYTPMKFLDDTYVTPRMVIQGHDGSITAAYDDYRDDLLLEFERRIYNNIKQEYNPAIFDVDAVIGGYYDTGLYTKSEVDQVIQTEFYKWAAQYQMSYTTNEWYDESNSFTYTYSNMTDPSGTQELPGYWRGVYKWFYDTDRPHSCPWEMLGFSQKPEWWESEYGPAPYTSNNLILWEDLRDGVIKHGERSGEHARYKRTNLLDHLPVDSSGKLLSPLMSRLANNFDIYSTQGSFVFGDVSPVEYAWRSSSDWAFTVSIAMCLLKPFEYISDRFDSSRTRSNLIGQTVHDSSGVFMTLADLVIPSSTVQSCGLITYLVDHAKSKGTDPELVENKIKNLDVKLSTRMSGFVVTDQQKYILDSKTSTAGVSVYVPPENYDIIFNVSAPIRTITYSGVVVTKSESGWVISGYNSNNQFFNYYEALASSKDPYLTITPQNTDQIISVGGVSASYTDWEPNVTYANGQIVRYEQHFYRALKTNSSTTFNDEHNYWKLLSNLPITGEVVARNRKSFNKFTLKTMPYGTTLNTIQEVVDFLLGYEVYLKSIGFVFNGYDSENRVAINWTTSCKEFMFWTKHNWAVGSLIALSPISSKIEITMNGGVVESLVDGFYDYEILKSNGQVFPIDKLNVTRTFQSIVITPDSTSDGIYYLNMYCVLKEHVAIFSDRTVFNDVIYDKTTGYRQGRIKSQGFRTVDWDGDYTSPGFLFDNVNINSWYQNTDYKLGDITAYRSTNWTCIKSHTSTDSFDNTMWTKLDSTPTKQLVSNFDYKINQFDEYYDTTAEGIGESQRNLARHAIGYQTREYLQQLSDDPVTQFQLYQGFIREKGTINSVNKVFDKLSRSGDSSIVLNEEWAFRVGQFGGVDAIDEIEFYLEKNKIKLNPQTVLVSDSTQSSGSVYQVKSSDFTLTSKSMDGINKLSYDTEPTRTAGYVNTKHVAYTVKTIDDILGLDIRTIKDNDNIWVTFDDYSWNVFRFNDTAIRVVDIIDNNQTIQFVLSSRHTYKPGDVFGVRPLGVINAFSGIFKVVNTTWNSVSIDGSLISTLPALNPNKQIYACTFKKSRYNSYSDINDMYAATLPMGSRLWIDSNDSERWEVIQKKDQYAVFSPTDYGKNPLGSGTTVVYAKLLNQVISSIPGSNRIEVYSVDTTGLSRYQAISLDESSNFTESPSSVESSFGMSMAISPDNRFLIIGSPMASRIRSRYKGNYDMHAIYVIGDIVSYDGNLWELTFNSIYENQSYIFGYDSTVTEIIGDGSTNTIGDGSTLGMWELATNIYSDSNGTHSNIVNQGVISVYEFSDGFWRYTTSFVSPDLQHTIHFGTAISVSKTADNAYLMAVSAEVHQSDSTLTNNHGIVYTYVYTNSAWVFGDSTYTLPENSTDPDQYGKSIVMDDNGTFLVISNPASENQPKGSVYIYNTTSDSSYIKLGDAAGDNFGHSIAINASGTTLVVTSPNADSAVIDQGKAYIFKKVGSQFELSQTIESFEHITNEQFGSNVAISDNKIVISARNSSYITHDTFDVTFDGNRTTFYSERGYAGAVYVFDKKSDQYLLTAELKTTLRPYESFGGSVVCTDSEVFVGSPTYTNVDSDIEVGCLRMFVESTGGWDVIANQLPVVDTRNVKRISLYDSVNSVKIQDVDYVDNSKLKILNIAEQEISFKTLYDPAVYTNGTDSELQIIEPSQSWSDKFVGTLWWDISKSKWMYAEQDDLTYRTGHWNIQVAGSAVDVYEWVESTILPSEWSQLADTTEGLASGISGQPMYPDDSVMTVKELYHPITGVITNTLYYYWVKNTALIPNVSGRRLSALDVSNAISNPIGTGIAFVGLCENNSLLTYNFNSVFPSEMALLNIEYFKDSYNQAPIHNEYQLLYEGSSQFDISTQLETKWIDSLIGRDLSSNRVPDNTLPTKLKYGIDFRPRQSMFIDRLPALKMVVTNVNAILASKPFTDNLDFTNLNMIDVAPSIALNKYDTTVDTYQDLSNLGITRVTQAQLSLTLTNGKVTAVVIVKQGYGYKPSIPVYENISVPVYNYQGTGYKGPLVEVSGDGDGAIIELVIDKNGSVILATIVNSGKKYSIATATVRPYSVLVTSDSTINGYWSIYAWDSANKQFVRSIAQSYDTTRYWTYSDWWNTSYLPTSKISFEVTSLSSIKTVNPSVGELVRIKEFESGGWAVFACTNAPTDYGIFSDYYTIVGRENGTIQLSDKLYQDTSAGVGYDNTASFDSVSYDMDFSLELRNILRAVKEDICIGDNSTEWSNLFFTCIRAVFAEQTYVDWAFKTSFLTAVHNIGPFKQPMNYKNDNLSSFQSYIDEVKPYRSTVREYISRYDTVEVSSTASTDFDLPVTYSGGVMKPVTANDWYSLNQYPWKWWVDNNSYGITKILLSSGGENYTQPPEVVITGTGVGASAKAYISNGIVSTIIVENAGIGYKEAPVVELIGGNTPGSKTASAIAVIGNCKVRLFNVSLKFDRISKSGLYQSVYNEETFVASGFTSVFKLMYAPLNEKNRITVKINGRLVLNSEYEIELTIPDSNVNSVISGVIVFNYNPAAGDVIVVNYEKHDSLLDSVNRIQKYYQPVAGMKGNQLSQLITGIDFGGVQVQGTTFDTTGGWDSQPWFTDNWDSVESNNDYYYTCGGPIPTNDKPYIPVSTITLPYVPADGEHINIYVKRKSWESATRYGLKASPYTLFDNSIPEIVRLDDIAYTNQWDSSSTINPYAQMPTFIGDGVNATIDVGSYFITEYEDVLIFRSENSDGSLVINDASIVDTSVDGGSLERLNNAYTTATGITAAEIIVEGGEFISPKHVSATEEHVPGQVLDSLSIKVFDTKSTGSTPLHSTVVISDGITTTYHLGLNIIELTSVIVLVNKVKKSQETDYSVDLINNTITFASPVAGGLIVEIIAIGVGGVAILDSKQFVSDGKTTKFITNAKSKDTGSVYATVNGVYTPASFGSTTGKKTTGKTFVTLTPTPQLSDVVNVVCFGPNANTEFESSIAKINEQVFNYDNSSEFTLEMFVNEPTNYEYTPLLVQVNSLVLKGVDTTYGIYDGSNNTYQIEIGSGYATPSNIRVYVNGELKSFLVDYVFNDAMTSVTLENLTINDVVLIENNSNAEYAITGNKLTIAESNLSAGDVVTVTWFSQYQAMKLLTDDHIGGKSSYPLVMKPIDASYVWIYVNGSKLTPVEDYYLSDDNTKVYLKTDTISTDNVKVILFGSNICNTKSYEISKDMLNRFNYHRYSIGEVKLVKELNYYDNEIIVNDASTLQTPIVSKNQPGVILVNGERIEYLVKTQNTLSQLRRGSFGTAIATLHVVGSYVADVSNQERLPYNEHEIKESFMFDGPSHIIGPLSYTPVKSTRTNWAAGNTPSGYGPCDQIEVFLAGRRLRKNPIAMFDESLGSASPAADRILDAEFSVDGTSNSIRLSDDVVASIPTDATVNVVVYKKVGKVWYDQTSTTASSGVTLLENNTSVAKFIAEKTTVVIG